MVLMILLIPLPWTLAWLLAVLMHELFHCMCIILCRKNIYQISVGFCRAKISTAELSHLERFFCALAGPIGGCTLCLFSGCFPRLALCGLLQSAYNILPIYPLDGGQALRSFLSMLLTPQRADRIYKGIEITVLSVILAFGFWCSIALKLGLLPISFALILAVRTGGIKIPCKTMRHRVQ